MPSDFPSHWISSFAAFHLKVFHQTSKRGSDPSAFATKSRQEVFLPRTSPSGGIVLTNTYLPTPCQEQPKTPNSTNLSLQMALLTEMTSPHGFLQPNFLQYRMAGKTSSQEETTQPGLPQTMMKPMAFQLLVTMMKTKAEGQIQGLYCSYCCQLSNRLHRHRHPRVFHSNGLKKKLKRPST